MSEEKRIAKVKGNFRNGCFQAFNGVEQEIELNPLTSHEKSQLSKAAKLMQEMEDGTPKRRAIAAIELHQNAEKGIKLEKELIIVNKQYNDLQEKYNSLLKELANLNIQVESFKRFPLLTWIYSMIRVKK